MLRRSTRLVRNTSAGPVLDTFLVFSIGSVLVTRTYLAATGYPQVGNGTFHIAHVLWGGMLMLIAIVVALTTIDVAANRIIAALGGIGFGLFIDEIGKFITKSVDYFFKPAIAIIYVCFISLFFIFRFIERRSAITADVALANALSILAEAAHRPLTADERGRVEHLLSLAPELPMTSDAHQMLAAIPTSPPKSSRLATTIDQWLLRPYRAFARSRAFIWIMAIYAVFSVLTSLSLATNVFLLIPESTRSEARRLLEDGPGTSVSGIGILVGSVVFGVMMGIGLTRLRKSRLRALIWFDRAYLFSILVLQVFVFTESQLAAISGLAIELVIWGAIRTALRAERTRGELTTLSEDRTRVEGLPTGR